MGNLENKDKDGNVKKFVERTKKAARPGSLMSKAGQLLLFLRTSSPYVQTAHQKPRAWHFE